MNGRDYENLRRGLGFTQAELAGILGVTRETIRMRESGRSVIRPEAWLAMEAVAGRMGAEIITRDNQAKTGRNEPCICGSRRKFKKCCGA